MAFNKNSGENRKGGAMRNLNMVALSLAIVAVSFAAVFARLAGISPMVIAAYRMAFAALILAPFAMADGRMPAEIKGLSRSEHVILVVSGLFLALHFALWIASLFYTTVASSVVFVAMNPLFVALYVLVVRDERVPALFWVGLAVALAGMLILGGGDISIGGDGWKGDLLAVLGAVAVAGYFIVGSRLRRKLSLISYIFPVYLSSAIFLLAAAAIFGNKLTGLGFRAYLYCFLMALVCQVVGHSLLNWTLRSVKPTIVTVAVLGEPVGASILAFLILGEVPGAVSIIGGMVILLGIFIAVFKYPAMFNE